jgi:hypothetical protein
MSDYTDIYGFWVAGPGTDTSQYVTKDTERWNIADIQLFELYAIFGNGVKLGPGKWDLTGSPSDTPVVYLTPGDGHVYYNYVRTTSNTRIDLVVPTGVDMLGAGVRYHLYAGQTETSHYDLSVQFYASTERLSDDKLIYLGNFILKVNGSGKYYYSGWDTTERETISIFSSILDQINSHVHRGGVNPPKINLSTDVKGTLQDSFIGSIDASKIVGKLSAERIPQLDHITDLYNAGNLTHEEIDSMISLLRTQTINHLGDKIAANLLLTLVMLKHVFLNIDQALLNVFLYEPGVTSYDYVDLEGTTALIDEETHQIVGVLASPAVTDSVTWTTTEDFQNAVDASDLGSGDYPDDEGYAGDTLLRSSDVVVENGTVRLAVPLNFKDNVLSGSSAWKIYKEPVISDPGTGSSVSVSGSLDVYYYKRFVTSAGAATWQDWSNINKLQFGISLSDEELLKHGVIKMFLIGADHETLAGKVISDTTGGATTSIKLSGGITILAQEEQTTGEEGDIKVITVDLLQFPDRDRVQGFGFLVSTTLGWDLSNFSFSLHQPAYADMDDPVETHLKAIDPYTVGVTQPKILMYGYNDLYHAPSGYLLLRFAQPLVATWNLLNWDVTIPEVPSDNVSPRVYFRTKTASTQLVLTQIGDVYDLVAEDNVIQSDPNKVIEIKVELHASGPDYIYTPVVNSATLYYTISSAATTKSYSLAEEFERGLTLINIAVGEDPDRLELADSDLVGAMYFLEGDSLVVLDEDKIIVDDKLVDGSDFYLTPRQAFAKLGAGFRNPRSLLVLDEGGFLIADSKNDRVIEIDRDGGFVRAVQGNIYLSETSRDFVALTAIYNDRLGKIYVFFSQDLSSTISRSKFSLATVSGTNSFSFLTDEDGTFTLFSRPGGGSSVLVIELSTSRKTQVDSWAANKVLTIAQGGVTKGGSASSSTATPETSGTSTATTSNSSLQIKDSRLGRLSVTSTATTSDEVTDETTITDFDGSGGVTDTLMGVDEQTSVVKVLVEDADVVVANLRYPVYADKVGDNYLIAQEYKNSIVNVGIDELVTWSVADTVIGYDHQKTGSVVYLEDESVLCASPKTKKVIRIDPATGAIVFSHTPSFSPTFARMNASDNYVIAMSDETNAGLNSRVYELNANGDVVREWGLGRVKNPNGVNILEDGKWLISC